MSHRQIAAPMDPSEFVRKWGPRGSASKLNERAGAQAHFLDLCHLLEVPQPDDPDNYCFERRLNKTGARKGSADVWKRGHFAWEYKAPGKDLGAALQQLMMYALPLDNPPLLIVSDRLRIEIRTHFTGYPSVQHVIKHEELGTHDARALLRSIFTDPERFKPHQTSSQITETAANSFAAIAKRLRAAGVAPQSAAHFLTQCVFCLFAEDVGLLPDRLFARLVSGNGSARALSKRLSALFESMRDGGNFGADDILWFNGGLFKIVDVPDLAAHDIQSLREASSLDWSAIDPSIFGTLFERGLDPESRAQLGAHYTDTKTIMRLVEPVVTRPLRDEWEKLKPKIAELLSRRDYLRVRAKGVPSSQKALRERFARLRTDANQAHKEAESLFAGFLERLKDFKILDPACGSGNFLFLSLKALKDVEHAVNHDAEQLGLERQLPVTGPHNVLGIEISQYASELARTTVWIGELQWRRLNGYGWKTDPVLDPLDQIECRNALVTSEGGEAEWPMVDVVVGNPPFVGDKKMRTELGTGATSTLRRAYAGRVPGGADLVCYWFEKARAMVASGGMQRAGLVATNSIRGGRNREVLDRVCASTRILEAWSNEPWFNDGAAVRVSLVAFGNGGETPRLNGLPVVAVYADLTGQQRVGESIDLTQAVALDANRSASFIGGMKKGQFDVPGSVARAWLQEPNPNGKSNAAVLSPWLNGLDVTRRPSDTWIVDFGLAMDQSDASLFERPFAHVSTEVHPARASVQNTLERKLWWLHARTAPELRRAAARLPRLIVTPRVSKHRLFVWVRSPVVLDGQLVVIARSDDVTFGILHSRMHELWSLRLGTSLEDRPRYTPTSCFETFPFPIGLAPGDTAHERTERVADGATIPAGLTRDTRPHAEAVANAAHRLVAIRDAWLNPLEWTSRVPDAVPLGMRKSPYPDRIVAKSGHETDLAKRTLTNLYNARPPWLARMHDALDAAVAAAYGWADYSPKMPDEEVLRRLLAENLQRAQRQAGAQVELPLIGLVRGNSPATPAESKAPAVRKSSDGKRAKLSA